MNVKYLNMDINQLIRKRRAVFPPFYSDKPIEKSILNQILENANWAPSHKLTEPWRFKVFQSKAKENLGKFLAEWYKTNTESSMFKERKYLKTQKKANQSACIIAICMQRDPKESIPEWEEIAAVACAVQNMWLSCTALGIGSYWSSPKSIHSFNEFMPLNEGEICLGFFYMGYIKEAVPDSRRGPIEQKVKWFE